MARNPREELFDRIDRGVRKGIGNAIRTNNASESLRPLLRYLQKRIHGIMALALPPESAEAARALQAYALMKEAYLDDLRYIEAALLDLSDKLIAQDPA